MKITILILLTTICFNIGQGQNSFHFKKRPQDVHQRLDLLKPHLPQFHGYRDLNEQVDSAWTRQYSMVQNGIVTSSRSYYTYTNEHLLASESYLDFYLENGEQYNGRQEEYFYNDLGQCTLHYTNKQDLASGEWLRKDREELVWNEESQNAEYATSSWDDSLKQFVYISKFSSTYTSSNQQKEILFFSWEVDHWKTEEKYNYEYNNADSIQVINQYTWKEVPGEWQLDYKTEYFYTNDTQLDSIIESGDIGPGLEPYSRDVMMYNEQHLLESDIYSLWDGSQWEPDSRNEYEYTPDGRETLWTYFEWDADEQRFVENYYEANTFTAAGDPLKYTIADYDTDAEAWEPWWITEHFYDENIDGSTIVWPNPALYEPASFHHKPFFDVSTLLFDIGGWGLADSVLYFYGNIISATIPVSKLNVNVYPNPACDQISIQMENLDPDATINFFDQLGNSVARNRIQTNVPVNISSLLPGAYVFQIRNGTELYTGKMLKE